MKQHTTGSDQTPSGSGRALSISTGPNRYSKDWKNQLISWEDLCARLATPTVTQETHAEFMKFSVSRQADVKDIGGFVGGSLKDGRRKIDHVVSRSMLTLDADNDPTSLLTDLDVIGGDYAWAVYSTHKHTPTHPRLRLIIPLDRDVTVEEHEAIARMIASDYGIDIFDHTCFRATQLMYWPSASSDGEYVFETGDGPFLSADKVLGRYTDWKDISFWPRSESEQKKARGEGVGRKQKDPLEKPGVVGAFCRTYGITDAIDTFLGDVYEPTGAEDRYTYKSGSTSGGLVIYDDKFAYSNHATDPASGILCNAFDLVRIHRFGDLDEEVDSTKTGTALPSYSAMSDFAAQDPQTKVTLMEERRAEITPKDYEGDGEDDADWQTGLTINKKGQVENTLQNLLLILTRDPALSGIVFNQLADGMEITGAGVPWKHPAKFWRDQDDKQLVCYIDTTYGNFSARNYDIAVTKVVDDRSYHPIRDMFESLPPWDGIPRVDTLLIDYLGAEDNPYVRAVTRKTLCAAYVRVYRVGTKFDYILVLNGNQGIGKSTLIAALGMDWYTDSLSISDMNDKSAAEIIQGMWIIEIGEMAGMKKADLEKVKAFISRQDDRYRASYGHRASPHPRQCVFFGTTNNERGYLRDITGNRRYWNVKVSGRGKHNPWDLTPEIVQQVWAEAAVLAKAGEKLYLDDPALEEFARSEQREAMEHDDREGIVREYLDMLLPGAWDNMDSFDRYDYFREHRTEPTGKIQRDCVSNMEIWCECFGKPREAMRPQDSYGISAIMEGIDGWERSSSRVHQTHYGRQRVYVRKTGQDDGTR